MVRRAAAVHVECLNERAEPVTIDATGWYARILQHEIDHLDGKLFLDRLSRLKRDMLMKKLNKARRAA